MTPCPREKPPAILLGLKPQGLFLLQELSRAGFAVHALDSSTGPGFHSQYGRKRLVSSLEELASVLREWHGRWGAGTRCYISSGPLLDYLLQHLPQIYDMFEVYSRPLSAVALLSNKMRTYALARDLAIEYPEYYRVEQEEPIRRCLARGERLIAKWNREWMRAGNATARFKTAVLGSVAEFDCLRTSLSEEEKQHLLVQRFIASDQDHNLAHLGYYVDGSCVAGLLAQQLRQYPQGITSYLREYTGPRADRISAQARALFARVRYTGFGEAEFKFDQSFSTLYLLEVNPRTCGWTSALRWKYPGIARVFARPESAEPLTACAHRVAWCNALRDMSAIVQEFRRHRNIVRLSCDLVSWARPKAVDGLDLGDMRPFIVAPVHAFFERRGQHQ
jgi:predicted ATP-grasp superfamily ATP-dependent carboligase